MQQQLLMFNNVSLHWVFLYALHADFKQRVEQGCYGENYTLRHTQINQIVNQYGFSFYRITPRLDSIETFFRRDDDEEILFDELPDVVKTEISRWLRCIN